jgi:hypothetical protein
VVKNCDGVRGSCASVAGATPLRFDDPSVPALGSRSFAHPSSLQVAQMYRDQGIIAGGGGGGDDEDDE